MPRVDGSGFCGRLVVVEVDGSALLDICVVGRTDLPGGVVVTIWGVETDRVDVTRGDCTWECDCDLGVGTGGVVWIVCTVVDDGGALTDCGYRNCWNGFSAQVFVHAPTPIPPANEKGANTMEAISTLFVSAMFKPNILIIPSL